jgi:maltose alpha-D-glucosyltransferase/alpha-amylase
MQQWAKFWTSWVSATFLRSYLEVATQGEFLPRSRQELQVLLDIYLLERSIYTLAYELEHRPHLVEIALHQVIHALDLQL